MKREKHNKRALLLGALALLAWLGAAFLAQRCADWSAGALVRWEGEGGVSPAQIQRAERYAREDGVEDPPVLTLWREKEGEALQDETRRRSAGASVLEFLGDGAGLWPAQFLYGSYPIRGDGAGCAVDQAVAEALWGTARAVGREVRWQGKTYWVRGVLKGEAGLMLVQGDQQSAEAWPNLLLAFPGGDQRAQAQDFLSRNQWSGGKLLDLDLLAWCVRALAALPALALLLGLLGRLLGRGLRLASSPLLLCLYLPLGLGGAGLALWCAGVPDVPDQLIPTRWADLDFWGRILTERLGGVGDHLALEAGRRDGQYWPVVLACVLLSLLALGLTVLAAERVRAETGRDLLLGWAAALGCLFLGALAFAPAGGVAVSRQMWLLPVLWLGLDWALERHEAYLRPRGETHGLEAD